MWLLPNGRASDRYTFRLCPGSFCKTPFRRGGVLRWFPVRSAEVSSASRTSHSLESPHTTAYPSKGRGWSTKEFTGCIRVYQKFTCLMVAVHTLKRSGPLYLFHSRSLWQLRDSANQFVHGLMPSNHHRVKHLLQPTTASAPFPLSPAFHRDTVFTSGNTPAPCVGAGSAWRLTRWPCQGTGNRIFEEFRA